MIKQESGTLFVVTGPSGAGKGTVLGAVLPTLSRIHYSVSATTRAPRAGEQDGKSYYFLNRADFEQMIADDRLLEYAEYVGNYYGTPCEPVDRALREGDDVILEIEVQGALQVKAKRPDAVLVFIIPPRFELLRERLHGRGSESEEIIEKRMAVARAEYECAEQYDYIVVNDTLETACDELRSIITALRCKLARRTNFLR